VSASEIFILVLMAIIALQMYLLYRIIQSSLETMRACSETSNKAYDLAVQALDDLVALSPANQPSAEAIENKGRSQ
jgi:hypothetical protein